MPRGNTAGIPSAISIGGVRFRLVFRDMGDNYGETHLDDKRIDIGLRCLKNHKELVETMRHEMLHAALGVSGVSFSERFDEEAVVRAIDNIFFPAWERMQKHLNNENKK